MSVASEGRREEPRKALVRALEGRFSNRSDDPLSSILAAPVTAATAGKAACM